MSSHKLLSGVVYSQLVDDSTNTEDMDFNPVNNPIGNRRRSPPGIKRDLIDEYINNLGYVQGPDGGYELETTEGSGEVDTSAVTEATIVSAVRTVTIAIAIYQIYDWYEKKYQ